MTAKSNKPTIKRQILEIKSLYVEKQQEFSVKVNSGKMKKLDADYHLNGIKAAIDTLEWIAENRDVILEAKRSIEENNQDI